MLTSLLAFSLAMSALVALLLLVEFLRYRGKSPALNWLTIVIALSFWWNFWNAWEYELPTLTAKIIAANLEYFAIPFLPVFWFGFARRYWAEETKQTVGRLPWVLWILPVAVAVAVWFDPIAGLVRKEMSLAEWRGVLWIRKEYGPLFWPMWIQGLVLVLGGVVTMIRAIYTSRTKKLWKTFWMTAGAFVPVAVNVLYVVLPHDAFWVDLTPYSFTFSVLILVIGVRFFRFLPLINVGAERALIGLDEPVWILDDANSVVFANSSARRFFDLETAQGDLNLALDRRIGEIPVLGTLTPESPVELGWAERHYLARSTRLSSKTRFLGTVVVLTDMTSQYLIEVQLASEKQNLEVLVDERTRQIQKANDQLRNELEVRLQMQDQLIRATQRDSLTDLANRGHLLEILKKTKSLDGQTVTQWSVLAIDLDDFHTINDWHGYSIGDDYLRAMARRMEALSNPLSVVARVGGDKFVLAAANGGSPTEISARAEEIQRQLELPLVVDHRLFFPLTSLGVYCSESAAESPEEILRYADLALQRGKQGTKHSIVMFEKSFLEARLTEMNLLQDLKQALVQSEIFLEFQPVVSLESGQMVGCEALARWKHPRWGLVPPDRFIPLAEHNNLIGALGAFTLLASLQAARKIKEHNPGILFFVACNVSAQQLSDLTFVDFVSSALRDAELEPSWLHIELTESSLMGDPANGKLALDRLQAAGIQVKLDDFGTGYSSLSYLNQFPFSTIKIDKSFLAQASHHGEPSDRMLAGIISLAHALRMSVVAEGVEDSVTVKQLIRYGCEFGQGFYFSRSVGLEELLSLVGIRLGGPVSS